MAVGRLQVEDGRWPVAGGSQQVAGYRWQSACGRLEVAGGPTVWGPMALS